MQVEFACADQFLGAIRYGLLRGDNLTGSVAKGLVRVLRRVRALFQELGIEVRIAPDSDPALAEYFVAGCVGGAIGTATGALAGASAWAGATAAGLALPPAGIVVAAAAVLGAVIGIAGGVAVTRMGLRLRFAAEDAETVEIDMRPSVA
jgi:hypothetical protein